MTAAINPVMENKHFHLIKHFEAALSLGNTRLKHKMRNKMTQWKVNVTNLMIKNTIREDLKPILYMIFFFPPWNCTTHANMQHRQLHLQRPGHGQAVTSDKCPAKHSWCQQSCGMTFALFILRENGVRKQELKNHINQNWNNLLSHV